MVPLLPVQPQAMGVEEIDASPPLSLIVIPFTDDSTYDSRKKMDSPKK